MLLKDILWAPFSAGMDKESGVYDSVNDETSVHS